ncbi:MAG: M48 family metalloprotease [Verrucomicrobiota bacterium]
MTAFTLPGNHIFFSRRLLERCRSDDMIAFVIAHEIAHHDLGHLELFPSWTKALAKIRGSWIAGLAAQAAKRTFYDPERECDADRHALKLCRQAGYDLEECLEIFASLEAYLLDNGQHDLVFGADPDSDQELSAEAPALIKLRTWAWTRSRGYLPVQDRSAEAWKYTEKF